MVSSLCSDHLKNGSVSNMQYIYNFAMNYPATFAVLFIFMCAAFSTWMKKKIKMITKKFNRGAKWITKNLLTSVK